MTRKLSRLRGLTDLLIDGVEHGSRAVEKVHLATAERWFGLVAAVPPLDEPTNVVRAVHDTSVRGVHGTVRLVTRGVGAVLGAAITLAEQVEQAKQAEPDAAKTEPDAAKAEPDGAKTQ